MTGMRRGLYTGLGPMVAVLAVLLASLSGSAAASSNRALDTKPTAFVWAGSLKTVEKITLGPGSGPLYNCSGGITAQITQTIGLLHTDYEARNVRDGVWEMQVGWFRKGAPQISIAGTAKCDRHPPGYTVTFTDSLEHIIPGYSKSSLLTLRYYTKDRKVEIFEPDNAHLISVTVHEAAHGTTDGQDWVDDISGDSAGFGIAGLPRLQLHPEQDSQGDYRAKATQAQPNVVKMQSAGFVRSLDHPTQAAYLGSPITDLNAFSSYTGTALEAMSLTFQEKVTSKIIGRAVGPDKDHDRLVDVVDPNASKPDADGDSYPDYWEVQHGSDPLDRNSTPDGVNPGGCCSDAPDSDGDGHSDPQEVAHGTDPYDHTRFPFGAPIDDPVKNPPPPGDEQGKGVSPFALAPGCVEHLRSLIECGRMASVAQTKQLALQNGYLQSLTAAELKKWCTSMAVSTEPLALTLSLKIKSCIEKVVWAQANQASWKIALNQAADRGYCIFYTMDRHINLPGLKPPYNLNVTWSAWAPSYSANNYLQAPGESMTMGGLVFTCR
jgi:hypothetical protein